MAGDEDKKVKKKKSKKPEKAEDAAPEPEPEPEAAPEPAPEPAAAEGDDWLSAANQEAPAPAGEGEDAPPADEHVHVEGGEDILADQPPAPKKKPKFFVHWDRKKAKFYDYNFDYGENYYSSVVNYLDHKNLGARTDIPRRKAFAERGIDSSLVRKSHPDMKTQNILNEVRSSIRGFETFQRGYAHDMNRRFI